MYAASSLCAARVEFIKGTKSKIPQEIFVKYPELVRGYLNGFARTVGGVDPLVLTRTAGRHTFLVQCVQRVTRDIHGIKIVVIQTGELGSYDTVRWVTSAGSSFT